MELGPLRFFGVSVFRRCRPYRRLSSFNDNPWYLVRTECFLNSSIRRGLIAKGLQGVPRVREEWQGPSRHREAQTRVWRGRRRGEEGPRRSRPLRRGAPWRGGREKREIRRGRQAPEGLQHERGAQRFQKGTYALHGEQFLDNKFPITSMRFQDQAWSAIKMFIFIPNNKKLKVPTSTSVPVSTISHFTIPI